MKHRIYHALASLLVGVLLVLQAVPVGGSERREHQDTERRVESASVVQKAELIAPTAAQPAPRDPEIPAIAVVPDAPNYVLSWFCASGSGSQVASGSFALSIIAGQCATDSHSSGPFAMTYGFWQVFGAGGGGCCVGRVGDANGSGDDEPSIGDISVIIDALFICNCPTPIVCMAEADINQSGGAAPILDDITIGDISILIDYLFITGPSLGLPSCL